jgi:hypothetical protein
MEFRFRDLWTPTGTINRGSYVLVGVLGFILKHNLDRIIATYGFHRRWGLFNYWEPLQNAGRVSGLHGDEARFLATLVATALPFIWVGVVLTLKRLRSAGSPAAFVILFFVPFLNLLFFLILSLLPERESTSGANARHMSWLVRLVPESAIGSAAFSFLLTGPIGLCAALLGTLYLVHYGWGLFVALPFTMGFMAAVVHGIRQPRSLPACIAVAILAVALLGGALLGLAFEGIICLAMAIPLALPLAIFGGVCGYLAQRRGDLSYSPALLCMALVFTPCAQWIEHLIEPPPHTFVVRSAIDINASPEKVWKQVVAFSEIPAPQEWIFRAGVAYPIRAEIVGSGVGAERHCVFSTGAFVEPIQAWDEPRMLKFSVSENPPPMQEWTPYSHIDPPHLHGFLISNGGQFLLTPLPNGGTRLEGTTWYRHGLWPANYWRLWSDRIIHLIHMRVLIHIRDEAQKS